MLEEIIVNVYLHFFTNCNVLVKHGKLFELVQILL